MEQAAGIPAHQEPVTVHSHDVDDLNHAVSGSELEVVQLKPGQLDTSLSQISVGDLSIDSGQCNQNLRVRGGLDPERYSLGMFRPGTCPTWNGNRLDSADTILFEPGRELNGCTTTAYSWVSLVIPPDWMSSICSTAQSSNMLRFGAECRVLRPDPTKLSDLWRSVEPIFIPGSPGISTADRDSWLRTDVRNSLGAAFSSMDTPSVCAMSQSLAHFSVARRAERYMRERIAEPVCIDEVCVAVHVSRRYLEYAFNDAFGTSPSRYLRLLRLHEVRRRLKDLGHATTVTNEAMRLGFTHLGQFSVQYRKAFGQSPSATLASGSR
jgi:AraC family ethanolamine operon transcriptional activator